MKLKFHRFLRHSAGVPERKGLKTRASSLVVTLLVIVVLSTIVVAFMQSMSIERMVAKSTANILKAELIADSARNAFLNTALKNSTNDLFIVVASETTNGKYTFIGNPAPINGQPNRIIYSPLFSDGDTFTATNLSPPQVTFTSGAGVSETINVPAPFISAKVGWVYITDNSGKTNGRYLYWAEDLAGYIDASVAGNTDGPSNAHVRTNPATPKNIALYAAIETNNTNGISTNAAKIIINRSKFPSTYSLSQVLPPDLATNALRNLNIATRADHEQDLVPSGRGYVNAGLPKTNINNFVSSGNVQALASYITTNLPQFGTTNRSGSAAPVAYINNLAASIIDYADSDSNPTTGSGYRGIDQYPFMTTHYLQFYWKSINPGGNISTGSNYWYAKDGTWHCRVDVTTFVQIWNIHDKPITAGKLQIHDVQNPNDLTDIYNLYSIYVTGNETPIAPEPTPATPKIIDFSATPLEANQFQVLKFGPVTYECDTGIGTGQPRPNFTGSSRPTISKRDAFSGINHDEGNYLITFNDLPIDRPGSTTSSRIERKSGTLDREGVNTGPDWRGVVVGVRYDAGFPIPYEETFVLGDPRGNMFVDRELAANDYDANSSWWGRHFAYQLMVPNGSWFAQRIMPSVWPDGGADTARAPSVYETNPGSSGTQERLRNEFLPSSIPVADRPATETNIAVSFISNFGSYTNILEIGRIYDPIKWRPNWITERTGNPSVPADEQSMTNSWQSLDRLAMTPATNYVVPGTLRIGRAEYATFNRDGLRSAQLLELFGTTNNPRISTKGRININTASKDTLRALVTGVVATNVLTNSPSKIDFPNRGYTAEQSGQLFAETVLTNRPFLTTAQMSWMTNSFGGFFGTTNQYSAPVPVVWNDVAREEFFRSIFDLTHVRSRNFRVWVIGEALDDRGRTKAKSKRVWHIFLQPDRTPTGTITNTTAITTYEGNY